MGFLGEGRQAILPFKVLGKASLLLAQYAQLCSLFVEEIYVLLP